MKQKHLKILRIIISLFFFLTIGFAFLDFTNSFSSSFTTGLIYFQFIPSLMKFLKIVGWTTFGFMFIILLTLFFGRVYCSTVCPLGILQDVVIRISNKFKSKRKQRFRYSKPLNVLRYVLLILVAISFFLGVVLSVTGGNVLVNWLDPYSNFGRIVSNIFRPAYIGLNNLGAAILESADVYWLYPVKIYFAPVAAMLLPVIIFIVVIWMSATKGRLYCNTICPVGTFLGLLSKVSVFKIKMDKKTCTKCGKCAAVCKASCINIKEQQIDDSRCIDCYNCIDVCPENSIAYSGQARRAGLSIENIGKVDTTKRDFIAKTIAYTIGFAGLTKMLKAQHVPTNKKPTTVPNEKNYPVCPPGAMSIENFTDKCTACHLCVSACPTRVIQPSYLEYGLFGIMQPHLDYHTNFCNFECTICSEVCPTGAILPLTPEEKKLTQIGVVTFLIENCIVYTDNTDCGACSEHCPTKAVDMKPYKDNLSIPTINTDICIGCGACEYACPTTPYKAIYVDGNAFHKQAEKPKSKKIDVDVEEDFPF